MAIVSTTTQYSYTGAKPLDSKALVQTYAKLLSTDTWTSEGKNIAYNGMITAVWLDKETVNGESKLSNKNGVYLLYDPNVTSTRGQEPDVTHAANWHKFAALSDIPDMTAKFSAMEVELTGIKTRLATLEADKVVIRRDNEYNYKQNTPANNEICLVDVAGQGLRVKIGDGETAWAELPYIDDAALKSLDSLIIKGYFYQNSFYADYTHTELLEAVIGRIYIDAASSKLYTYNGTSYEASISKLPNATAEVAGAVKLYDQPGQNIDGTMTQRAITDELDEKVEMVIVKDEEMLILGTDLI